MNYIYSIAKIAVSLPILLIHILINLFINLKIGKLDTSRIGNIYVADLFLIKKKIKKINQLEIWVTDRKICNSQMYKMLNRHFKIFNSMRFYYDSLNFLSLKNNFFSQYLLRLDLNKDFIYHDKSGNQIKFSKQDFKQAKILAENLKIPDNRKVICISCRDDAYLKKSNSDLDFSYHNYRDTNINSFIPIIKKLIKKKYFVIRVGKISKTRLKIKSKYFLDYPFSKYKNDLLDFYFPNICSLWIGSNNGLDTLAHLFRKPTIVVNLAPLGILSHNLNNKKLIYHFKSHIFKKSKKLSFSKIFEKKLDMLEATSDFKKNNISLKPATDKEISEICWEGLNYHLKKKKLNKADKQNQNLLITRVNSLFKNKSNVVRCKFSPIFLKKNKWLLSK